MMKDTKTYCFGRFLIDLPKAAEVNGQAYEFMFGKIEVERFPKGEEAFVQKMKEREEELKAAVKTARKGEYILTTTHLSGRPDAKIFVTSRTVYGDTANGFELYRYSSSALFSMKGKAFDPAKFSSVLRDMETKLIPNLRHRRAAGGGHAEETPTEPGFCIEKGVIADDGKTPQYEKAELNFRFKEWPDVIVSVYARTNGDKLEESLLSRIEKPFPIEFADAAKSIKVLRKGKHAVNQHQGEEVLDALPTGQGYFVHDLVWDVPGEPRSIFVPHIHLELKTGNGRSVNQRYMRPSLTDKQAIELYDAIVNSIRLRPTTPGKTSAADPDPTDDNGSAKRLPLGTKVSSLRSCPESGIYECASDAPGVTERRVFIAQGRPMPSTFMMAPKRGVAHFFGAHEEKEVETTWTLAAYAKEQA